MAEKLDAGAAFPTIRLNRLEGGVLTLPHEIQTDYAIVLFYRGQSKGFSSVRPCGAAVIRVSNEWILTDPGPGVEAERRTALRAVATSRRSGRRRRSR